MYITEFVFVKTHGPFASQADAAMWIQAQGEPDNPNTVYMLEDEA